MIRHKNKLGSADGLVGGGGGGGIRFGGGGAIEVRGLERERERG